MRVVREGGSRGWFVRVVHGLCSFMSLFGWFMDYGVAIKAVHDIHCIHVMCSKQLLCNIMYETANFFALNLQQVIYVREAVAPPCPPSPCPPLSTALQVYVGMFCFF